jgi:hypothetical protein
MPVEGGRYSVVGIACQQQQYDGVGELREGVRVACTPRIHTAWGVSHKRKWEKAGDATANCFQSTYVCTTYAQRVLCYSREYKVGDGYIDAFGRREVRKNSKRN